MQVLNYSSKDIEGAMALTDFELAIQSRKMNGYTLFMCHYRRCNNEKKNDGVVEIINVESDDDMSSGDNLPSKTYKKVNKDGSKAWKELLVKIKMSWKMRSSVLNSRPVPGLFDFIPPELSASLHKFKPVLQIALQSD